MSLKSRGSKKSWVMRGGGPWAAKLSSARVDLLGVLARLSEVLGRAEWQQCAKGGIRVRQRRALQKATYPLPAGRDNFLIFFALAVAVLLVTAPCLSTLHPSPGHWIFLHHRHFLNSLDLCA